MSDDKALGKNGLQYLWNKLKSYVDSKATDSTAYTITLTTSGWTEGSDGRYYQTVSVTGVTTDISQVINVDCALDGTDLDADAAILEAWQGPSANNVAQGAGTLTFYSYDLPTVNIPINVGVA